MWWSIPPLRSSYRPDLVVDDATMIHEYEAIVRSLIEGEVDILVCESMSCVREATVAITIARRFAATKPVWLAVTLQDTMLPDGVLRAHPRGDRGHHRGRRRVLGGGGGGGVVAHWDG